MSLKNVFGKKNPGHRIYRIGLKPGATPEESRQLQMDFERDLRLWLKGDDCYNKGVVAFVKRGHPSASGERSVIISTAPAKIAEIAEKFESFIATIHVGRLEDVLTYKGNQPRP